MRAGSRTRFVATAAPSIPRKLNSSSAQAAGSARATSPPFASTEPTFPGSKRTSPTIATIASAPILSTVVVTATAPTDRVPTRLLSTGSQSTIIASPDVVARVSSIPNSAAA